MNNSITLLVIDDDLTDAKLIKYALADLNVSCGFAHFTSYREMLEYLRNQNCSDPCVILADLNTPEMNGFEFLKIIKDDRMLKRIPIIILSGSSAQENITQSFDLGAVGYIIKPIDYEDLKKMLGIVHKYWTVNKLPAFS